MVSISTYGGWAGIALIGAGYWYLQSRRITTRPSRAVPQKHTSKSGEVRKEGKSKKQRSEGPQSGGEQGNSSREKNQKQKKQKTADTTVENTPPSFVTVVEGSTDQDEVNNKEFARQFQNAKSGTIATSRPQASARQKSVKQSQLKDNSGFGTTNGLETSSNDASKASSSNGADGDEELSATNSADLGGTRNRALQSGDISDILEMPTAGPSILRITEPATSLRPKKETKPAQPTEVTETKKQRQHRRKAQERKEAREEEEKERKILMEKQRRTAREAEGRAAKDGSRFMAAMVPKSSAWTAQPTDLNGQTSSSSKSVDLLDTYEPGTNGASLLPGKSAAVAADETPLDAWDKPIPSEEEQMRLLEEDMAWNTVTSKKAKKKVGDVEQASGKTVFENDRSNPSASKDSSSKVTLNKPASKASGPVTIVGDPSIDMSNFSYKGSPANAVLDNGDGLDYGYTMADDEWEVA